MEQTILPKGESCRQGDISLHIIDNIPAGATEITHSGTYALADSIISSASHRLEAQKGKSTFQVYTHSGETYLNIMHKTLLNHCNQDGSPKDHSSILISGGKFIVKQEQEYDPFEKQLREVAD